MFRKPQHALQSHSSNSRRPSALAMQHFRPALEPLEQRMLLTVFNQWDFEGETLGEYTTAEIGEDFNGAYYSEQFPHSIWTNPVNPGSGDGNLCTDIVNDTINGQSTKVLRVTQPANQLSSGFNMDVDLETDRDELWLSYNYKVNQEFCSTYGGKMCGIEGLPIVAAGEFIGPEDGFVNKLMFNSGGRLHTYHYDRTDNNFGSEYPYWSNSAYDYNDIHLINGVWYNITQRAVMNTFTNGVANDDGIEEVWIDGRMLFQKTDMKFAELESVNGEPYKLDDIDISSFLGGSGEGWAPPRECYTYFDNFRVYLPDNDDTVGTHDVHDPNVVLTTLVPITGRTVVYDTLRTTTGTLQNSAYGSNYAACTDETYLIDAGAGNVVNYHLMGGNIGTNDYLFVYDGNQTDSPLIYETSTYASAAVAIPNVVLQSTGRYMFVRLSTDSLTPSTGFTGTVSFSSANNLPTAPSGLVAATASTSQINLTWTDNSITETGFELYRATNVGMRDATRINVASHSGTGTMSYSDTGLDQNSTYYYCIRAVNASGHSSYNPIGVPYAGATTDSNGTTEVTYYSIAAEDGYIVESSENSGVGDFAANNVTTSGLRIGDRASPVDAQILSVVSFDTSAIPDDAIITSAILRLRRYTVYGTSPASWGGQLRADIKGGSGFGGSTALAAGDFQAAADAVNVAQLSIPISDGSWAEGTLDSGLSYINLTGKTQFRIYFQVDDNDNSTDDQICFYPGDGSAGYRPELVITYTTGAAAPTAPSGLGATAVSSSQINLSWTDNSTNETAFEIDRATNSSFTSGLTTATVSSNVTSYSSTGLTEGTTYYYRVRSTIGGSNDSANSNAYSIATLVPVDVTWTGVGGSTWSTAVGSGNWKKTSDSTSADYFNGVDVVFNDTATGTIVNISAEDVTPTSVTFNNSSDEFVVTGVKGIAGTSTTVLKQGSGTVIISSANTYGGVTTVEAGTLKLNGVTNAQVPVLTGAGADIKSGMLVLDYSGEASPAATVNTLINNGKIHSSVATATYGLGWIDNTTTHAISIAYTVYGDANLDGSVNFSDLSKLLSNYGHAGVWADGDFNYDGMVDFADLSKLLSTYGQSIGLLIPAGSTSDVPPASVETPAPLNIPTVDAQASTTVLSLQPATARIGNLPADTARTTSPTLVDMSHAEQSEKITTLLAVQYQSVTTALDARLAHWVLRDSVEANLRSPMVSACVPVDPQTHHSDGMLKQHRSTDGAMTVRSESAPWVAKMVDRLMSLEAGDTVLDSEEPAESLGYFDSPWDLDWIARREATTSRASAIGEVLAGSNT